MTSPSAAATAAIETAYDGLDFSTLTNPVLTWYSSSVADTHPGKWFHLASWCPKLKNIKTRQERELPYLEVARQVCGECFDAGYHLARLGRTSHRLIDVHTKLLDAARLGPGNDAARSLKALEWTLNDIHLDPTEDETHILRAFREAGVLARAAILDVFAAAQLDVATVATYTRSAALALASGKLDNQGSVQAIPTGVDTSILDGHISKSSGSVHSVYELGHVVWTAFDSSIRSGSTPQEAAAAAKAAYVVGVPQSPKQFPEFTLDPGQTTVNYAWLVSKWEVLATRQAHDVIDAWASSVATLLEWAPMLGDLTLVYGEKTTYYSQATVVDALLQLWPASPAESAGYKQVTAPALIVFWLAKLLTHQAPDHGTRRNPYNRHEQPKPRYAPAGDNTEQTLEVFRVYRETHPLVLSLALARGTLVRA